MESVEILKVVHDLEKVYICKANPTDIFQVRKSRVYNLFQL